MLAQESRYKIGFVSLGCPKALVDSERIITQLRAQGYELVNSYHNAGLVIINTCGFIEAAIEESLTTIKEAMAANGRVVVTGCLGAKAELILKICPDILHISGAHAYEEVVSAVNQHLPPPNEPYTQLIPETGIKLTPRHYAYLKIAEGCNQKCTFCIIPTMRGKLQSYPLKQILTEAQKLKKAGVKEILLIAQDTSAYGVDQKFAEVMWQDKKIKTKFYDLCSALGELGLWIRLHYIYPYPHIDDIIPLMQDGLILPYLDLPLQHANAQILRAMKRPANSENTLARLAYWRSICPEITIRSTFIVGFPGETEENFQELLNFLTLAQLDRVGCFQYSPVDGAKSNNLPFQVTAEVKERRYLQFMETQAQISYDKLAKKTGSLQTVLVDEVSNKQIIARSKGDAPEIDGVVYLPANPAIKKGDLVQVRINHHDHYDLFADFQYG